MPSLAAKVSGNTSRASFTSAETVLYLALKCVRASLRTPAFFASSAASTEVECFFSAALSASRAAKVESKINRSTPEKKPARVEEGLVSPE